jgi:SAM-dependent methyltransferase
VLKPARIIDRLGLAGSERVLEIGPGPGFFSVEIARRLSYGRLDPFDIQPEMLEKARQRLKRAGCQDIGFTVGQAGEGLPLPEADGWTSFVSAESTGRVRSAHVSNALFGLLPMMPPNEKLVLRLRRDVQQLSSLDRRTTSPGERQSADWIARRLGDIGATDVAVTEFRSQSSWGPANVAYELAALAVSTVPGKAARLLAAALAASYELEVSGRNH